MNATPRTDAVTVFEHAHASAPWVTAAFARKLETENQSLRQAVRALLDEAKTRQVRTEGEDYADKLLQQIHDEIYRA